MIATGGLLRMNRRQNSDRSKNRAENKRKRKAKRRKKNDIVVVKGKLNLCSPSGLVAAVGVVVLMVGIAMAVLGYWPVVNNNNNNNKPSELQLPGRRANGKMSFYKNPPRPPKRPGNKTLAPSWPADQSGGRGNSSGTEPPSSSTGFLQDFLDSYLYSDNLKVFGPLVMGIGIFLFICANAVLHENRDKKTKVINLRDIYSTVIDLHRVRTKEYSPLNGLVNYSQTSRAADATAAGLLPSVAVPTRGSWPCTALGPQGEAAGGVAAACRPRGRSWDVQTFTDTVYSIYRDQGGASWEETPPRPGAWETTSIVASSVNAVTLPVIKLNNCEVEEGERAEKGAAGAEGEGGGGVVGADGAGQTPAGAERSSRTLADTKETPRPAADSAQGAPRAPLRGRSQTQLLPPSPAITAPAAPVVRATASRLSLNSLSEQPGSAARRCSLSVSVYRHGDRARRFSCPRLERSNSKGYIKLTDLGGESFEAADADADANTDASSLAAGQEVAAAAAAAVVQGEEAPVTPDTSAEH